MMFYSLCVPPLVAHLFSPLLNRSASLSYNDQLRFPLSIFPKYFSSFIIFAFEVKTCEQWVKFSLLGDFFVSIEPFITLLIFSNLFASISCILIVLWSLSIMSLSYYSRSLTFQISIIMILLCKRIRPSLSSYSQSFEHILSTIHFSNPSYFSFGTLLSFSYPSMISRKCPY